MSILNLLERLAEMFPKQDYQTRLENYINLRRPKTAAELEHYQKQFERYEFTRPNL